jgi:hypothetical protein
MAVSNTSRTTASTALHLATANTPTVISDGPPESQFDNLKKTSEWM